MRVQRIGDSFGVFSHILGRAGNVGLTGTILARTFVDNATTVENARDYRHTHLSEIVSHADKFENKAILLIHFSAHYTEKEIKAAVSALPPPLAGRVFALTEGF